MHLETTEFTGAKLHGAKALYSIIGSDLSLSQERFDKLEAEFGPHDVDACALADGSDSKLSKYWANSIRHNWSGKNVYCFPPFEMVGDLLRKFLLAQRRSPG